MIIDLIGNASAMQMPDSAWVWAGQWNPDNDYCEDEDYGDSDECVEDSHDYPRVNDNSSVWIDYVNKNHANLLKSKKENCYLSQEASISILKSALQNKCMREVLARMRPVFRKIIDSHHWSDLNSTAIEIEKEDRILWENRKK